MPRESTIKLNFMLELTKRTASVLEAPGITKGTTTLVTLDATDPGTVATPAHYVVGEFLYIDGTGWPSLDGKAHLISAYDGTADTVTLAVDTSAETGTLPTLTEVTVQSMTWEHVCLSEFTPSPGTPGEIDVTTMCDTERKNLPGLATPGTASFTGMFDLDDDGMNAMIAANAAADARYFVGVSRLGQMAVFHGVVSSFAPGPMTVEAALTYTGSFTLDESPYYMKMPA